MSLGAIGFGDVSIETKRDDAQTGCLTDGLLAIMPESLMDKVCRRLDESVVETPALFGQPSRESAGNLLKFSRTGRSRLAVLAVHGTVQVCAAFFFLTTLLRFLNETGWRIWAFMMPSLGLLRATGIFASIVVSGYSSHNLKRTFLSPRTPWFASKWISIGRTHAIIERFVAAIILGEVIEHSIFSYAPIIYLSHLVQLLLACWTLFLLSILTWRCRNLVAAERIYQSARIIKERGTKVPQTMLARATAHFKMAGASSSAIEGLQRIWSTNLSPSVGDTDDAGLAAAP